MTKPDAQDPTAPIKKRKRKPKARLLAKFTQKRGVGRTPIYEAAPHCARARTLALLGLTDVEIADQFGIAPTTFERWKIEHPEFKDSLARGKIGADAVVAESMYQRATGTASVPAVKIFLSTPDKETGAQEPIIVPYTERFPADVNAGYRWLYNRQPDRWRDRKQVEHMGSLEHRISLMTPEERRGRLIELQARAQEVIEGATDAEVQE